VLYLSTQLDPGGRSKGIRAIAFVLAPSWASQTVVTPLPTCGVLSAQALAQTRPGAPGAVLCYSALPLGEWGDNWPARWPNGVRLQLHILDGDEDFEIAQRLAATVSGAELFVYPGSEHYFAEHDEQAAALLMERVLDFLAAIRGRP
jgi:dienelactone hydrolase